MTTARLLFVLTGHDTVGRTGKPTGFHAGEAATPWAAVRAAGGAVDFASPGGGRPPVTALDPADPDQARFLADPAGWERAARSLPLSAVDPEAYAGVYFVGGHGAMWDFPDDARIQGLTRRIWERGGSVAAICHGQAALVNTLLADGTHLVRGRSLTAFPHHDEHSRGLADVVPFSLQHSLQARGAVFTSRPDKTSHVVVDGRLLTGQNPASARALAERLAAVATVAAVG